MGEQDDLADNHLSADSFVGCLSKWLILHKKASCH